MATKTVNIKLEDLKGKGKSLESVIAGKMSDPEPSPVPTEPTPAAAVAPAPAGTAAAAPEPVQATTEIKITKPPVMTTAPAAGTTPAAGTESAPGQQGDAAVSQITDEQLNEIIKTRTQGKFNSWAEAEQGWAAQPPTTTGLGLEFKDDYSKALYENIRDGNTDAVYNVLSTQRMLKDVDNIAGEDAIQLSWKLQHPEWTAEDIADEYAIRFENMESTDVLEQRRAKRLFREEENKAKTWLKEQKKQINLPSPNTGTDQAEIEAAVKQNQQYRQQYMDGIREMEKNFDGYEFNVKDDDMEISSRFKLADAEKKNFVGHLEKFDWLGLFNSNYAPDGKFNVDRLARDMWMIERDEKGTPNYEKMIGSLMRQVFSQAKKAIADSLKGGSGDGITSQPGNDPGSQRRFKDLKSYMEATR